MRILIFHGYLLGGTGSNVYNACLAAALSGLGHEVHLLCQESAPEKYPFVDAIGSWEDGRLRVRVVREPVRVTVYRPDIGPLLPVYVHDRYDGFEVRTFGECGAAEIERYIERNVAAVAEVAERAEVDAALANHLIMGPAILARALGPEGTPYAVKVHGSALEYAVKPDPERFLPFAREGLAPARGVLVGSRHTAESLWAAIGDDRLADRTRLGPPGVDVRRFRRRAVDSLRGLAERLADGPGAAPADPGDGFALDAGAAGRALAGLDPDRDRIVTFTGKLIVSKGVDLLLAAWPLVLARVPRARLVIVGFGAYRAGLERMVALLSAGDRAGLEALAAQGRGLEGGDAGALPMLQGFLAGLGDEAWWRYAAAAARAAATIGFTGRLEHADLAELLPACEAQVVPSTFPEAFGMVAAEAAACGVLPISADHSGLAEVTRRLAAAVPPEAAGWLSFRLGPGAVDALAARLIGWLEAPPELRERTRAALAGAAREDYSWAGVARGVLAAAAGRLDGLAAP
ncbi:MAG: glycosyltransferase family 4 protein [Solirubrobacteraceae bacterium]